MGSIFGAGSSIELGKGRVTATKTATRNGSRGTALGLDLKNDAVATIASCTPYVVEVTIAGTAPILFHRWSCEDVAAKGSAAKGSAAKRTDNVESYVYRDAQGLICLPGEYLRQSVIHAAKYRQDPRSPRKSAMDMFKAGVVVLTELAPLGKADWDYLDQRRVTVQRSAITRVRPAFLAGWRATVLLQVQTPEYIEPTFLLAVLGDAGRLVGVGDNRPSYGRFQVVEFRQL